MTWIFLWDTAPSKIFVWDSQVSKVFVWDTQVRPSWWQPWADTILYLPLEDDLLDHSWNNISITDVNVTLENRVAKIDNTNSNSYLKTTNNFDTYLSSLPFTVVFWVKYNYVIQSVSDEQWRTTGCNSYSWGFKWWNIIQWYHNNTSAFRSECLPSWWEIRSNTIITIWSRYLVWLAMDSSWRTLYINWQPEATGSGNITFVNYNLFIGQNPFNNGDISNSRWMCWYVSKYIVEKKKRTAQEFLDYYNQTKANYWIS